MQRKLDLERAVKILCSEKDKYFIMIKLIKSVLQLQSKIQATAGIVNMRSIFLGMLLKLLPVLLVYACILLLVLLYMPMTCCILILQVLNIIYTNNTRLF